MRSGVAYSASLCRWLVVMILGKLGGRMDITVLVLVLDRCFLLELIPIIALWFRGIDGLDWLW
jgi:hypothetical protein